MKKLEIASITLANSICIELNEIILKRNMNKYNLIQFNNDNNKCN